MTYETIKNNYVKHLWTIELVRLAVSQKFITPEQFKEITGENY